MSEQDHHPKANHLRFSLALASIIVIGLTLIGVQKILQWRVEDEQKTLQDAQERASFHRKSFIAEQEKQEPAPRTRIPMKRPTTPVVVTQPNEHIAPTNEPTVSLVESTPPPATRGAAVAGVPRGTYSIGSIYGTVLLNGTPPPEKEIVPLNTDPTCGKLHKEPIKTRLYLVGTNSGLANAFVYIEHGLPVGRKYRTTNELLLDQVGCLYEPYVSGVMVNQRIKIRNSDPVLHNVHATPTLHPELEFNFGQPVQGQVTTRFFSKPEVMVRFKCDVHPWMFAYVGVVEHPFFAVTDAEGHFEIKGVPPGFYSLEAMHLKAGRLHATTSVSAGAPAEDVVFTFQLPN